MSAWRRPWNVSGRCQPDWGFHGRRQPDWGFPSGRRSRLIKPQSGWRWPVENFSFLSKNWGFLLVHVDQTEVFNAGDTGWWWTLDVDRRLCRCRRVLFYWCYLVRNSDPHWIYISLHPKIRSSLFFSISHTLVVSIGVFLVFLCLFIHKNSLQKVPFGTALCENERGDA